MTGRGVMFPGEIIRQAIGQLLEEMYFCPGGWGGEEPVAPDALGYVMAFTGTFAGELRVASGRRLASQFAADFLAVETDEIDSAQAEALVSEFANVACGAVLGAWMPEGNFNLALPRPFDPGALAGCWPNRFHVYGGEAELGVDLVLTG